jgi:hypothetical protein
LFSAQYVAFMNTAFVTYRRLEHFAVTTYRHHCLRFACVISSVAKDITVTPTVLRSFSATLPTLLPAITLYFTPAPPGAVISLFHRHDTCH